MLDALLDALERRLKSIGLPYAIWAVSPNEEVVWPADEKLLVGAKLIGLQFKQAKISNNGPLSADRLHWSLHQPVGQFALVKKHAEIFYCLPTFVNRGFRDQALDHCLFWRPGSSDEMSVWYDNPAAHTSYKRVRDAMRWGLFLELVLECPVGKLVHSPSDGIDAISAIQDTMREYPQLSAGDRVNKTAARDCGLYVVAIAPQG